MSTQPSANKIMYLLSFFKTRVYVLLCSSFLMKYLFMVDDWALRSIRLKISLKQWLYLCIFACASQSEKAEREIHWSCVYSKVVGHFARINRDYDSSQPLLLMSYSLAMSKMQNKIHRDSGLIVYHCQIPCHINPCLSRKPKKKINVQFTWNRQIHKDPLRIHMLVEFPWFLAFHEIRSSRWCFSTYFILTNDIFVVCVWQCLWFEYQNNVLK